MRARRGRSDGKTSQLMTFKNHPLSNKRHLPSGKRHPLSDKKHPLSGRNQGLSAENQYFPVISSNAALYLHPNSHPSA